MRIYPERSEGSLEIASASPRNDIEGTMYKIKRRSTYGLILLAFFIQVLLGNFLNSAAIKPNLMIIMTIFCALFTDEKFGCRIGAISGLLLDIFTIRFFGLNTVLFAFGGYVVGKYNGKFYRDSVFTHFIITFVVSFFILSLLFLFASFRSSWESPRLGLNIIFNSPIFFSSLLNSFLGVWIYAFLVGIFRLHEREL